MVRKRATLAHPQVEVRDRRLRVNSGSSEPCAGSAALRFCSEDASASCTFNTVRAHPEGHSVPPNRRLEAALRTETGGEPLPNS
jgi:hypothetical protein